MIGIDKAFESAMLLQDFCQQQDDCFTCIFHVSHQKHNDDFAYANEIYVPYCLLNRSYPENWAMGIIRGEREGKGCDNCANAYTDVCNDCRHCYEKWKEKTE